MMRALASGAIAVAVALASGGGPRPTPACDRAPSLDAPPCPEPPATTVACTVRVLNLPVASLDNGAYRIELTDGPRVTIAAAEVSVEVAEPTTAVLVGAMYEGAVDLDPATCGGVVTELAARVKPAEIDFRSNAELEQLVVSCVAGCRHETIPATAFPSLSLARDQLRLEVTLRFQSPGFRARQADYVLMPGTNTIRVHLDPL